MTAATARGGPGPARRVAAALGPRHVVLIGLMGAGKTTIGRRLAELLGRPFLDSDAEIEKEAGRTVRAIFERDGEAAFRTMEGTTLRRLLGGPAAVVATGGGAFLDPGNRRAIGERAVSLWLRADLDTLDRRTRRRATRPLLAVDDPRAALEALIRARHPVYAKADVTVDSGELGKGEMTCRALDALDAHLAGARDGVRC